MSLLRMKHTYLHLMLGMHLNVKQVSFVFDVDHFYIRDRPIFMGIRDREFCNGTTGYFGPLVEWGHRLFWGLALRGHGLFQCRISTGPKIILKYCGTGSWIIFSFFRSFSYKKYGTRANIYYGTKIYFGRRFQRGRGKFLTKRIRGHTLFCMVKSTGPR